MDVQPFSPTLGGSITIAASTTSAQGTLSTVSAQFTTLRVVNATTGVAFIRFTSTQNEVATSADTAMLSGTVEVFSHAQGQLYVSVLLASGTGNVYVVAGEGQ
jgi:hypothetical protein